MVILMMFISHPKGAMTLKSDKERISVYLDTELKGWLSQEAKNKNRSMSNYIGTALERIKKGELTLDI